MRALLVVLAVVFAALLPAQASAAGCSTPFGSLPKEQPGMGTGEIDSLRVGRHECFDRLVVQVDGPAAGWRAEYVPQVTADGSGNVVPVAGGARIQFVVRHPAFSLGPVGRSLANVAGFQTLRDVRNAGSFEGQTTIGVGVRARLPFRVFTLAGPGGQSRIVLDVAHRWS
jgi:hypothetical protein